MKRSPLHRKTAMRNRAALNRQSELSLSGRIKPKRRSRTTEESAARDLVMTRAEGLCEGCGKAEPLEWSHRKARSQGGPWCASNGMALCRPCHRFAHAHPIVAKQLGWHVSSYSNPETRLAWTRRHGLVLLRPDGSITSYLKEVS